MLGNVYTILCLCAIANISHHVRMAPMAKIIITNSTIRLFFFIFLVVKPNKVITKHTTAMMFEIRVPNTGAPLLCLIYYGVFG